jgi:plastocyanin
VNGRFGSDRPLPRRFGRAATLAVATALLAGGCAGSSAGDAAVATGPVTATIVAKDIAWAPTTLSLPADVDVTLVMDNQDDGVPHDLKVLRPGGGLVAKTAVVLGPTRVELHLGTLTSGTYAFTCEVHPGMDGTIRVSK